MKVLLNDGMDKEGIKIFEGAKIQTDSNKRDPEQLIKDIPNYDAVTVRSATKITKEVIESGTQGKLKVIGRAGVGYDNIDVDTASKNGIVVKIAPHGNSNATAELALGLMLSLARNIPYAHKTLKEGTWHKKQFTGTELSHKTLGILGCGRIGQRLNELVRGFDMEVIGYDQFLNDVKLRFPNSRIKYVSKEDLIKNSDFISIHTGGKDIIIGGKELSNMKSTAYLINASRGNNINEEALYESLKAEKIAGAGLDSYVGEPKKEGVEFTNKLRELENVVLTSHLGASTKEAQIKTSTEMATVIRDYLLRGDFKGAVNAGESVESEIRPTYPLFIHHQDTPGAFAKIDKVLSDYGINIRENPSRLIGKNGKVITAYLVHNQITKEIKSSLESINIVYRVR